MSRVGLGKEAAHQLLSSPQTSMMLVVLATQFPSVDHLDQRGFKFTLLGPLPEPVDPVRPEKRRPRDAGTSYPDRSCDFSGPRQSSGPSKFKLNR